MDTSAAGHPTPARVALRATFLFPAALLTLAAAPLGAQVVQGRLVDATSERPVEGAMISIVAPSGDPVASTLSNAVGLFMLTAPTPGTYTLRAERIGFSSAYSHDIRLAAGDTVIHRMETRFEPVALEGISVEGEKRCEVRPEEGRATAVVWDEARKALEAAAWTQEKKGYTYRILNLRRRLGPEGRKVREEDRSWLTGFAKNPITSRPAPELVERGFARQLEDGDWMYYAPDARVLLSDAFLDTHCMSLRNGEDQRAGLLGLHFEPIEGQRTPDIAGTLWLDPTTSELRRLDYRYVNVERLLDNASLNEHVGGDVVFRSLPNGSWIVQEYRIRMPLIARQGRPGQYQRVATLTALQEESGLVRRVQNEDGETILSTDLGTITGTVVDSTGTEALEGAVVRVEGTGRSDRTDESGRFWIGELQDGDYRVTYTHRYLDALGYRPEPRSVEVQQGEVTTLRFETPSRGEALALTCQQEWEDSLPEDIEVGAVFGTVREQEDGPPVGGANVQLFWSEWGFNALVEETAMGARIVKDYKISENRWGADVKADESGVYSVCGVPTLQPIKAVATWGPLQSDTVVVTIENSYVEQNLALPFATTAVVEGQVVDFGSGEPLAGARVSLPGEELATTTDSAGRFRFGNVPGGLHPLAVQHGDWSAVADTVAVQDGQAVNLEIRIPSEAIEIEGITVEVLSTEEREWRATGYAADYAGPEEMATIAEKVQGMANALRSMGSPRIKVTERGGNVGAGLCIESLRPSSPADLMRGGGPGSCQPMLVVVNGNILQDIPAGAGGGFSGLFSLSTARLQDLNLEDIESVRVLTPTEARFRFGSRGDNGAVIVTTRSNPR